MIGREQEPWYPYIGDINAEIQQEIQKMMNHAIQVLQISDVECGDRLADQIYRIVDEILATGKCPTGFENMTEAALSLGCLYGHAYVIGRNWSWKAVGDSPDDAVFAVVSPEEDYFIPVLSYINRFLSNADPTKEIMDNTVLLLYNMMEESVMQKPKRKLTWVS